MPVRLNTTFTLQLSRRRVDLQDQWALWGRRHHRRAFGDSHLADGDVLSTASHYHHAFTLSKLLDRIGIDFERIGLRKHALADRILFHRLAHAALGDRDAPLEV